MAAETLAAGRAWLETHGQQAVVVPHSDADGLSAGALLAKIAHGGVRHVETPWEGAPEEADAYVIAD